MSGGRGKCRRDPDAGQATCWYWWDGCPDAERRGCFRLWVRQWRETHPDGTEAQCLAEARRPGPEPWRRTKPQGDLLEALR
jgi:hypothetical protein